MIKKYPKLLLILLLIVGCRTISQPSLDTVLDKQQNLIDKYILDNGLTVLLKPVTSSPLVCIEARINTGSATEGRFLGSGISHFIEHMLFKGTPTRAVGKIAQEIKSYGGSIDANTSYDTTAYSITVPKENLVPALRVLADCLMHPAFDKEELGKERQVIIKEIMLNEDRPLSRLWNKLFFNTYLAHPYRYPVIGYESLLKNLTRDDLINYHKMEYEPNNMTLAIVGGLDKDQTLQEVKKTFGQFQMGNPIIHNSITEPQQISTRQISEELDINLSYIGLGFHTVSINSSDLFSLDVLANILGQGESSHLNQELKENLNLVYSIEALNYTPRSSGLFIIQCTTKETDKDKIINSIFEEIEKIKNVGINDDKLNKAKESVIADYLYSQETVESQATDLTQNQILTGDPNFSLKYVEEINRVSAQDIIRVALEYLIKDNLTTVILLPKEERKVENKTQQDASEQTIIKYTLDNGLKVLLYKNKNLAIVSIKAVFLGGLRAETQQNNGISDIFSDMFIKGTKTKTAKEIQEIIESKGGSISTFSANNSFGLSLELLSQDLDLGLNLLSDILLKSTLPEKELEKEKSLSLGALRAQKDDIFTIGQLLAKKSLYSIHPYGLNPLGSEDSIKKITQKQLIEFHQKYVNPSNMVLCVFGDFSDIEQIKYKINALFANIESPKASPINTPTEPPIKEIKENTQKISKEQSLVMLAWPTVDLFKPDRYTLGLIASLLSDQDGRLFKKIRDNLGLAYTLGAINQTGLDNGYFLIYVASAIGNAKEIREIILSEIRDIKTNPIDSEELNRTKTGLIGENLMSQQRNSDLALRTGLDELYGLGFDNYKQFKTKIESISQEDVRNVAAKYFLDNAYVVCIINP